MNDVVNRDLLAQLVIVLAVCVGGWMILVQPAAQKLAEIESAIDQSKVAATGLNQDGIEKLAGRMDDLRQRVRAVERRNHLNADSSHLYGQIMNLAREHEVTIRRLQPGSGRELSSDGLTGRTNIEIAVEGDYQKVAAFLSVVGKMDGFIKPVSLIISPRQGEMGEDLTSALYTCQALNFTLSDALSQLGGPVDGDG